MKLLFVLTAVTAWASSEPIFTATFTATPLADDEPVVADDSEMLEVGYQKRFADWMSRFQKEYATMELFHRFKVYKENWAKIEAHNAGDHTYTLGENQFMDLTAEEFTRLYLNGVKGRRTTQCAQGNYKPPTAKSIDWVAKGMVTKVKNQGQCGSCWSFSATGAVESHTAIKSGKPPVPLSEQQLVDCSASYGNQGCQGGLMDQAFEFLIDNGGSCTEEAYPYTASQGQCQTCKKVAPVAGCEDVKALDPNQLKGALEQRGPVSIAVEADQLAFQFYHSGVLTGNCGTNLDHGVLVVGYDDSAPVPYWKVKNSWGEMWGEQGYLRIEQALDKCGVELKASIPIIN